MGESIKFPDNYEGDILLFFHAKPQALAIYSALLARLEALVPEMSIKVQKSQVSFYGKRLFAMACLPRLKSQQGLLVSFGLGYRLDSPRIMQSVEPYPGRFTHHVLVEAEEELDGELMGWIQEAYHFSQIKSRLK